MYEMIPKKLDPTPKDRLLIVWYFIRTVRLKLIKNLKTSDLLKTLHIYSKVFPPLPRGYGKNWQNND